MLRFFLKWMIALAMTTPIPASQTPSKPENSSHSNEVHALTEQRKSLQKEVSILEAKQDKYNAWYLGLAIAAAISAFGLGIASWVTQRIAAAAAYEARPLTARITRVDARLREISDQDSKQAMAELRDRGQQAEARIAEARAESERASAKAESFRLDIAKANESAKEAEARAAAANLELARLRVPRSLNDVPSLLQQISNLGECEYVFTSVFQDEESIRYLKAIDALLQQAHWKRGPNAQGFPGVNVYGDQSDLTVPIGLNTDVRISARVPNWDPSMAGMPLESLPEVVRAAVALNLGLFAHTAPPRQAAEPEKVPVEKGEPATVMIAVGKKP